MLRGYDAYSSKRSSSAVEVEVEEKTDELPPKDQERAWGAFRLLKQAFSRLDQLEESISRVRKFQVKAQEMRIDDNERRLIHRQYRAAIKHYNQIVKEEVEGQRLFDGSCEKEALTWALTEAGNEAESIKIRIPSLEAQRIGLEDTRVDSIVHARGAEKILQRLEAKFKEVREHLKAKWDVLEFFRQQKKIQFPSDEAEQSSKEKAQPRQKVKKKQPPLEADAPIYRELRSKQEKAAESSGRESALLINTKA